MAALGEEERRYDGLIMQVNNAFERLQKWCEYYDGGAGEDYDCHHPERDFDCVSCAICNCPFLV